MHINKFFNKVTAKERSLFLVFLALGVIIPVGVLAGISYGSGWYTNLCGSGTAANFYSCPASCNPSSGDCSGTAVVKFTCSGNLIECTQNESAWTTYHKVDSPHPGCDKTVQIDVFNHNCRDGGGWSCDGDDLLGYMVWYSGPCCTPPTVDLKANGSNGPITINYNTSATLSWTSTNATSCSASGDWSGSKATSGSQSTGNLTSSKTYTLTCSNGCGTASDSVVVNVGSQPTLWVTLNAPSPVCPNTDVTLAATVSGTATGTINYKFDCNTQSGGWDYEFNNISTNPKSVTCRYSNAGSYQTKVYVERGSASPAFTTRWIEVNPPSPTTDIKANGSDGSVSINYNTSATLSWTSTNATSCSASGDWSGSKATSGSQSTGNLTSSKTYTLTCSNGCGTASDSVVVNVGSQPNLSVSLSPSPSSGCPPLNSNLTATVSGTATGTINYKFDCTNDGVWDYTFNNINDNPKTVSCSYPSLGTYTAKVYVERGSATPAQATTTITVLSSAPSVDLKVNGYDGAITIDYNSSATLSWTSTNATSCSASGNWYGSKAISGSESTGNLTSSKTYTLTCSNACGSTSDSVTVNTSGQSTLFVDLSANPDSGCPPLNSNLTATVSGTATGTINYKFDCTNDGSWDYVFNNVSEVSKTVTCHYSGSGTYIARVYIERGSATAYDTASISVGSYSPTVDIKVNGYDGSTTINYNTSATLSWTSTNATYCTASGSWSGSKAISGSESTGNLASSKAYTLICSNSCGSGSDSVIVYLSSTTTDLIISKQARNISRNQTSWYNLVYAYPSERIEFKIEMTNTGSTVLNNIIVKDSLPSKMTYKGNLKIDGQLSSGDIINGFDTGDLNPGQVKIITFEAELYNADNFIFGTTTLINAVLAYNNQISRTASAQVSVTRAGVAGAITEVPTGILTSAKLAFIISSVITLVISYLFLLRYYLGKNFRFSFVKEVVGLGKRIGNSLFMSYGNPQKSEKKLEKLILSLREKEK